MRVLIIASLLLVACNSVALKSGDAKIAGTVAKPHGNGPFPGLVLLHGCGGPQPGNALWAAELNSFQSFSGRGAVADAYAALDHLRTLPFVDNDRIGAIGWSQGASRCTRRVTE